MPTLGLETTFHALPFLIHDVSTALAVAYEIPKNGKSSYSMLIPGRSEAILQMKRPCTGWRFPLLAATSQVALISARTSGT